MTDSSARGILFVISAPSGTGKSTLASRLIGETANLRFSVSFTTRSLRQDEEDGKQYHFVDDGRFDAMIAAGELLEWAEVFRFRYGTGREATRIALEQGRDLLLDIDVQGAEQVRRSGIEAVYVFVLPPDYRILEQRLRGRASDDAEQVAQRLEVARSEAEEYRKYDYVVVNDDLEAALAELRSIVTAERSRVRRRLPGMEKILTTFPQ